jgi:hypothetical protein
MGLNFPGVASEAGTFGGRHSGWLIREIHSPFREKIYTAGFSSRFVHDQQFVAPGMMNLPDSFDSLWPTVIL